MRSLMLAADLSTTQRRHLRRLVAARTKNDDVKATPQAGRSPNNTSFPLTPYQEAIWTDLQFAAGASAYNIAFQIQLPGHLDRDAMRQATESILHRHPALRGTIREHDGSPMIEPLSADAVPIQTVTLGASAERDTKFLDGLIGERAQSPFEMPAMPLFRVEGFDTDGASDSILLVAHHLICDGASMDIVVSEFVATYAACASDGKPAFPPTEGMAGAPVTDFRARCGWGVFDGVPEDGIAFWKQRLSAGLSRPPWRKDDCGPDGDFSRCGHATFQLSHEAAAQARRIAKSEKVSMFAYFLSVFICLLRLHCHQERWLIGVPVNLRDHTHRGTSAGMFVNMIPLQFDLAGADSFRSALRHVAHVAAKGLSHMSVPLQQIIAALNPQDRPAPGKPFFDVTFSFQRIAPSRLPTATGTITNRRVAIRDAKCGLNLDVIEEEGAGITLWIEYDESLFAAEFIERFGHLFERVAVEAAEQPEVAVEALSVTRDPSLLAQQAIFHGPPAELARCPLVPAMIDAQCKRYPDEIAVVCGDTSWTYRALNERAARVAAYLEARGLARDRPVAMLMEPDRGYVAVLLGIWRTGRFPVLLDPGSPVTALLWQIEDSGAQLLIYNAGVPAPQLRDAVPAVPYDQDEGDMARASPSASLPVLAGKTPAYYCYTSGSTGRPKAVVVNHHGLAVVNAAYNAVWDLATVRRRVLQLSSPAFDVCIANIMRALCHGGAVIMCPTDALKDPAMLLAIAQRTRPGLAEFVPGVMRQLMDHMEETGGRLDGLDVISLSSDYWHDREFVRLRALCGPRTRLFNTFGSTETTIDNTIYEFREDCEPTTGETIGTPMLGVSLYVLDERLRPVMRGCKGEIFIGGWHVSQGYLKRPDLTAERFVADPFRAGNGARMYRTGDGAYVRPDGSVGLLGRLDDQISLRGLRIEPAGLENNLIRYPDVVEACVVPRRVGTQDTMVAFVRLRDSARRPELAARLKAFLADRLRRQEIPPFYHVLDTFPKSSTGKIDRGILKKLPLELERDGIPKESETAQFESETERALAQLWEQILGHRNFGRHQEFFTVGGHSMLVARLLSRIETRFGTKLGIKSVLKGPTVANLANLLDAATSEPADEVADSAFLADADLPVDALPAVLPSAVDDPPGRVLLTGVTGFLGARLLRAVLDRTTREVVVLGRAPDALALEARVHTVMRRLRLSDDLPRRRIEYIPGYLDRPRFGWGDDAYGRFAVEIDAILHGGFQVNFVYPYEALRATNVEGSLEILRFATRDRLKTIHFVSSVSAIDPAIGIDERIDERAPLGDGSRIGGGYNQSKWVVERLYESARERGARIFVHRPAFICAESERVAFNERDLLWRLIRSCARLGLAPKMDTKIDVVSSKYIAETLAECLRQPPDDGLPHRFHFCNPQPVPWRCVVEMLRKRVPGLTETTFGAWRREVLNSIDEDPEEPLAPFRDLIEDPDLARDVFLQSYDRVLDSRVTVDRLKSLDLFCPSAATLVEAHVEVLASQGAFAPGPRSTMCRTFEEADRKVRDADVPRNAIVVRCGNRRPAVDASAADGPLAGLPFTVKEAIAVSGLPWTTGDPRRSGTIAQEESPLVRRMEAAGAVLIGKTNCAALSADWQCENPVYGKTEHPFARSRTCGGSSGGAAAVAAGLSALDIGTDLIGSVRIPAAFCGVYGLKPTDGLIPRDGCFPAPATESEALPVSMPGLTAASPSLMETALRIMAAPLPGDAIGPAGPTLVEPTHEAGKAFRIAMLPPIPDVPLHPCVHDAFSKLAQALECSLGGAPALGADAARLAGLALQLTAARLTADVPADDRVATAAHFNGIEDAFLDSWASGLTATAADYIGWLGSAAILRRAARVALASVDAVLAPVVPCPAFECIPNISLRDASSAACSLPLPVGELPYLHLGVYASLANLLGLPSLAFPAGRSKEGLPIGLQLIGAPGHDLVVLGIAKRLRELNLIGDPMRGDD